MARKLWHHSTSKCFWSSKCMTKAEATQSRRRRTEPRKKICGRCRCRQQSGKFLKEANNLQPFIIIIIFSSLCLQHGLCMRLCACLCVCPWEESRCVRAVRQLLGLAREVQDFHLFARNEYELRAGADGQIFHRTSASSAWRVRFRETISNHSRAANVTGKCAPEQDAWNFLKTW